MKTTPWQQIGLRSRIYFLLTALVAITSIGGMVLVWYTLRTEDRLTGIIDTYLVANEAAEALEIALVNQKGFVSYYFLDGNPDWLRQLGEYRQIFKQRLTKARQLADITGDSRAIEAIAAEYLLYIKAKDRVIAHYQKGEREQGAALHIEARERFFNILRLCEDNKESHKDRIIAIRENTRIQARKLRLAAYAAIFFNFCLSILLIRVLIKYIFGPVHRLAVEASRENDLQRPADEIKALGQSVRGLIENVDQTQFELEKSRENLLQAEKMAMVGKLAAGMAHSIRNPFTSVKMRLFSLERGLAFSEMQKEDFDVISEEIRHIDIIIQNFLEFARPPKLEIQAVSPSTIVDASLQLLAHRLRSYDVTAAVARTGQLPLIEGDPEQLKELIVNLIINACEAMAESGGRIDIEESRQTLDAIGPAAILRIHDNGPGIPLAVQNQIFQPFFTTKANGTGLGLSIVRRIIDEHRGHIEVDSTPGMGTGFTIALPIEE